MTPSIIIKTELVSTNVNVDSLKEYFTDKEYEDNELVKYRNKIFRVLKTEADFIYTPHIYSYFYLGDIVSFDGVNYRAKQNIDYTMTKENTGTFDDDLENLFYLSICEDIYDGKVVKSYGDGVEITEKYTYSGEDIFFNRIELYDDDRENLSISHLYSGALTREWYLNMDAGESFIAEGNLYTVVDTGLSSNSNLWIKENHYVSFYSNFPTKAPFDGLNRTTAFHGGMMEYVVKGLSEFDTVAVTNMAGSYIEVTFDLGGEDELLVRNIDNIGAERGATELFYSSKPCKTNTTVKIKVFGSSTKIGGIYLGKSVEAGFSELEFSHGFIDYSPTNEDQWGNVSYTEGGAKIITHKGSCYLPLIEYSKNVETWLGIGGKAVILNGSDAKNIKANEQTVFASTLLVGRVSSFSQQSVVEKDEIKYAKYSFEIRELV